MPPSKSSPNGRAFRNQLTSFVVGDYAGSSCKVADSDDDIPGSVAIQIGDMPSTTPVVGMAMVSYTAGNSVGYTNVSVLASSVSPSASWA